MERMRFEYGKQIKAFFHFAFKHFFELEFGIRVAIEVLLFVLLIYTLSKVLYIIFHKIIFATRFIYQELVMPLRVRFLEKLAFSTSNQNWQERANKIKDAFKKRNDDHEKNNNKKSHAGFWIVIYIILIVWIIGFHYFGEEKRRNYEVFFLGENVILTVEEWITNTLLETDECAIECFFHNKLEMI